MKAKGIQVNFLYFWLIYWNQVKNSRDLFCYYFVEIFGS